jgi:DNA polymerase-3 subunit epsilon
MTNLLTPASVEDAAALVAAHPDYRVLRALPSPEQFQLHEAVGPVRTAAVIDVETLGLGPDDPIIDLAIQRIAFDARGRIVRLGRLRQWFEDPGVPIPPEISALTGILDEDVRGRRINDSEAVAIIAASDLAIAHNAAFDAPRVERRLPGTAGAAWACSCAEIDWPALGLDGRKLGHLLMQCGMFHQGHRAGSDVWATVNLLAREVDGTTMLARLIERAECSRLRVEATHAPFAAKDLLKSRGYRWDAAKRVWWREIDENAKAIERAWLASECDCRLPTISVVTWRERHRPR